MKTLAIHESKKSEKISKFVTGVYELMQYCSKRQAKNIYKALESGRLYGAYFTKTGNVKAQYNW